MSKYDCYGGPTRTPFDEFPEDEPMGSGEWLTLCRRTNDPKLAWIEKALFDAGIANRRNGKSVHAPILEVDAAKEDEAWAILDPVDDIDDDDPMFQRR